MFFQKSTFGPNDAKHERHWCVYSRAWKTYWN